jgi:hypothetical protein
VVTSMARFVDRLQTITELLPLRTIPLEIRVYGPVEPRMRATHQAALDNQWRAIEVWQAELDRRFSASQRAIPITDVALSCGRS